MRRSLSRWLKSLLLCVAVVTVLRLTGILVTLSVRLSAANQRDETVLVAASPLRGQWIIDPTCKITRPSENTVQFSNKEWQVHRQGDDEIFVFSAFYDDRALLRGNPIIRVMAVAKKTDTQLFCHVWYDGHAHPYVTKADVTSVGRGDVIRKIRYGQYMYNCPLDGTTASVPTHVSISTSQCGDSSIFQPVVQPGPLKHEFGVCVAVSFGKIEVVQFAEWMELHLLLGVTEINVYNATMSSAMSTVFSHYQQRGVLKVHQMPPPVDRFDKVGAKLGSPASLNDCMYRNAYRYKLMVVVDFDEVVVPRLHSNYSDLIRHIDEAKQLTEHWWSYSFRNVYFFREFAEEDTDKNMDHTLSLMTQSYTDRVKPSKYLFAAKSFIDPRRCISVFNHYCYIRFPQTPRTRFTLDVPTELAMSHHYRDCNFGKEQCAQLFKERTADDFMYQYRDSLRHRVSFVLRAIDLGHDEDTR